MILGRMAGAGAGQGRKAVSEFARAFSGQAQSLALLPECFATDTEGLRQFGFRHAILVVEDKAGKIVFQ